MLAVLAVACGRVGEIAPPAVRAPSTLRDVVEKMDGPPGYSVRSDPAFFNQDNLHEAINGMAPEYISYGCEALGMTEWTKAGKPDEKVQMEIYDMGSPLGAFGIYSRAHVGNGEFCDVGEEAAVTEDSLELSRGRYYVRLMGPMDARSVLEAMARSWVLQVAPGPRPESFYRILPGEGRIPRTERWMPEGAFGMDFLRRVWIARYRVGDREVELFLTPFEGEDAAQSALDAFRETMAKQSPQPAPGAYPGFVYEDQWIGRVGVFRIGRTLAIVVRYDDSAGMQSLLGKIAAASTAAGQEG